MNLQRRKRWRGRSPLDDSSDERKTYSQLSVVVVSGKYGQKHRNQLLRRGRRYAKIFADNKSLKATNERLTFRCTRKMSPDSIISMRVTLVKIRITSASLGCPRICCFSRIFLSLVSFVCVTTIASRLPQPLTTPSIHLFGDALLTYYTHTSRVLTKKRWNKQKHL